MFTDEDERLIGLLAAHAAIAIENARLYERSRELQHRRGAQPARARAARLGDASSCSASCSRSSRPRTLLARDPAAAAEEIERVRDLARGAMEELRAVVFELRPASLEARASRARCASTSTCCGASRHARSS